MATILTVLSRLLKTSGNAVALCLVSPSAATCWIEKTISPGGEGIFNFWSHVFAVLPGQPGIFLRRGFYRLTLARCSASMTVGFGAFFAHREAEVGDDVYVGPFAVIGRARLGAGTLIGTRASLLSGSMQHEWDDNGRLRPSPATSLRQIEIGQHTWIGEAATVMADVGDRALVSAGAVVSTPVPGDVVVAGNPARFVRRLRPDAAKVVVEFKERGHEPLVHLRH